MTTATPSLSSLLSRANLDDHEQILKAANATLKASKNDSEAQHARVVALLKLDRYDDAVRAIEDGVDVLKQRAGLEHAYSLYKCGNLKEARNVAHKVQGRAARFVEAQAAYREEHFEEARKIFEELKHQENAGEEHDLRINTGAIEAQILWQGKGEYFEELLAKKVGREELEAFETAYNAACMCIAKGDLKQAEILLRRARELCKHSDDLSQEDMEAELLPMSVQQLYVLLRLEKTKEAELLMSDLEVSRISDLSTRSIAQHNVLCLPTKSSNPFITHKLLKSTPSIPQSDALFTFQSRKMTANSQTVDLLASKHEGVARSTAASIRAAPSPTTDPYIASLSVLNAAAKTRSATSKAAIKKISKELNTRPSDVGLLLTLIRLYALNDNLVPATTLLESFFTRLDDSPSEDVQNVRYNPGLIGLLITLYKRQNRTRQIKSVLAEAAIYWSSNPRPPRGLLLAAGTALSTSDLPADQDAAKEIFTSARIAYPDDHAAIAGYIAAYAISSPDKVAHLISSLPSVESVISKVNVDELLALGIPPPPISAAKTAKLKRKAGADGGPPKKKRLRKNRLPKNYVEGKTPDPERWLPLRERSGWRPKKGKKGKGERGGAQGGFEKGESGLGDSRPSTATGVAGASGGGGGKKKKKGKR